MPDDDNYDIDENRINISTNVKKVVHKKKIRHRREISVTDVMPELKMKKKNSRNLVSYFLAQNLILIIYL